MDKEKMRIEKDTMGEMEIPASALWGSNTERARLNLPISNRLMPEAMLRALARIKACYAKAAGENNYLAENIANVIENKALEVASGVHKEHFPLDVFQTGSGTSSNMNVNEVVANLANISLGGTAGEYNPVNPNDHVNFGQSSNDTIPAALHLAALDVMENKLLPELSSLIDSWQKKADEYGDVVKTGRTHLQDALPITFGHVFGAYVDVLKKLENSLKQTPDLLSELPLGGTAVGTGFQAPEELPEIVANHLSTLLERPISVCEKPLVFMSGRPVVTDVMGRVSALAMEMQRIANDVRMMASGPRLGYGELTIPSLQPGSSIMPGKVNPIVCESVVQVAMSIAGNNATVLAAAAGGQFELNVTLPVTADALLSSIETLAQACFVFRTRVVDGLVVNVEEVGKDLNRGLALATALISKIGYAEAAKVAYKAHSDGVNVSEAAVNMGILKEDEVDKWLDPAKLTKKGRLS